jgi:hypothetical protein
MIPGVITKSSSDVDRLKYFDNQELFTFSTSNFDRILGIKDARYNAYPLSFEKTVGL